MKLLLLLLLLLTLPSSFWAIVNPNNDTANMIIYLLPPNDTGPHIWQVGVDCLDQFSQIFFYRNPLERYTRAYNLLQSNVFNMSTPAAQISQEFSKLINEVISKPPSATQEPRELFQLRVVSDHVRYQQNLNTGELLLSDNYVIVVDSVMRLHRLMSDYVTQMRSWNPGARFLVLFNNPMMRHKALSVATSIFNDLMSNFYVHRVALIYATSDTDYNLLVNDYYSNVDCRILRVQSVGQCHNGTLYPNDTAVHKSILDYNAGFSPNNCTFYLCAAIAAPFVEADCVLGIEMRILGFMKNRLNFQTNQSCLAEKRGERDAAGNWSGLLGKLTTGECDFIVGGFYPDNEVAEYFWVSDCYLQDAYTWYIHLASRRTPWRAMVGIFSIGTWLTFLATMLFSWLVWFLLMTCLPEPTYYQPLSLTAINTLAVSIGIAINERPICRASRLFFFCLTIYSVNVGAFYTSKMIGTFQDPGYLHQLDDMYEVAAEGIPFGGREENRDWFENKEDMWIYDEYNTTSAFLPTTVNLLAVEQGERCLLSNRMYILQNQYADSIFAFEQNIFSSPIQMIMKAGFPFLYEVNLIIRNMRDVGIFQKIDDDFRYNNTYLNRIAKMRPKFASTVIVLTTEHMKGPFFILVVGISCALFTFLGELLSAGCLQRCSKRQRRQQRRQQRQRQRQRQRQQQSEKQREQMRRAPISLRFTPIKRRKVL